MTPAAAADISTAAPVQLAAGDRMSCAIADGRVYCWGRNDNGNLGDGTTTDRSVAGAVRTDGVLNGKSLVDVAAAGHGYACVLDTAGAPYCWGENEHSQIGDGTIVNSHIPVAVIPGVLAGKSLRRISDEYDHTCVLDATGQAYCWGHEDQGGLGNGAAADVNVTTPTALSQPVPFRDVSTGEHLTCAIGIDQRAYCWGDNDTGGVGDNSTTDRTTAVAVYTGGALAGKSVAAISSGTGRSCALDTAGKAYCWGDDTEGALGDGSTTSSDTPQAVRTTGVLAGKHLVRIETDQHHTCALDTAGKAYCWGNNSDGQLGDSTTSTSTSPVAVDMSLLPAGTAFTDIRLGYRHTCAQTVNGRIYCWGSNNHGQLGDGTTTSRTRPGEAVHGLPALPSSPTGLTVSRSGTTADVSWTAPADTGTPALLGYIVTATPGDHTCHTTTANACQITGLSAGVTYHFTVSASSILGDSLASVAATSPGSSGSGGGGSGGGGSGGGSGGSGSTGSGSSGSHSTGSHSGSLAVTGTNIVGIAVAGLGMAALGSLAVIAGRRRRST